jgi:CBS domain-containing protein
MAHASPGPEGSYRTQSYEHATVGDAMRQEVISCPPETPLRSVAQTMAQEHIHCVIVGDDERWGAVTDIDLLRLADADLATTTAGEVAARDLPSVSADERLDRAGQLMVEHEVSHLLVVDPRSARPIGVLSTLDVAGILGWGRA